MFAIIFYVKKGMRLFVWNRAFYSVVAWFLIGVFSYGLYRGVIYDYYFGSMFSVPFILTAVFLYILWRWNIAFKIISIVLFVLLIFYNLEASPFKREPNNMLKNTEEISRFVFNLAAGLPYNFALIAGKNSDHAYRYFLEVWGNPPVVIENFDNDPERKTVQDKLLIVCEEKVCSPLGHPLWEIAGFGRAEITDRWRVSTAEVISLKKFNEEKQ
jgi:hypothetical protein